MTLPQQTAEPPSWKRIGEYLRAELAFYPGRLSLIIRIVTACTLSMVLIMVFRMPGAALGAYFPILLSRDSPHATLRAAFRTSWVCTLGTAELLLGAMMLIANPFTHLLWVFGNLLLVFYLISAVEAYDAAVAFGFMVTNAIAVWDMPLSADGRVTRTLFSLLSIVSGCAVAVCVEYLFAHTHAADSILEGIRDRLTVVAHALRNTADQTEMEPATRASLLRYMRRGTGDLRERLSRSDYGSAYREQLAAALSLTGRMVELTAQLATPGVATSACDRSFCRRIGETIDLISQRLGQQQAPEWPATESDHENCLPLLVEMERIVELTAESFNTNLDGESHTLQLPEPGEERPRSLFLPDAFTSPEHLKFAIRGTLAAGACYLAYMSVGWDALGASVATCVLTALRVTGAGRHKMVLRFAGVLIGACVLGILSQALLLPQIDSIQAFALLFAGVIAIGAWIGTSSPRLAYSGAQIVLAYDLVSLNSFAISPSLVPARNAVLGILLGSAAMWLIFDRLWTRSSAEAMKDLLPAVLRDIAKLGIAQEGQPAVQAKASLWAESERLTRSFDELRSLVDFSAFEGRPDSEAEMLFAGIITELQPQLRALVMIKSGLLLHQVLTASDIYGGDVSSSKELANTVLLRVADWLEQRSDTNQGFTSPAEDDLLQVLRTHIRHALKTGAAEAVTELRLCFSLVQLSLHLRDSVTQKYFPPEALSQHQLSVA